MKLTGHFELDQEQYHIGEPLWVTLVLQNNSDGDIYLFIACGRNYGLQITVKQGDGGQLKDLSQEPEAGLIPEQKLSPNETLRQQYELSQWLTITEPGNYIVECAIEVEAYETSLHQADLNRVATNIPISTNLHFTVRPNARRDD